jgi:uncharacterized delta-60 repeat protein
MNTEPASLSNKLFNLVTAGFSALPLTLFLLLTQDPSAFAAVGSMDASFNPPSPLGWVYASVVQPDGKIIIAGDFTQLDGTNRVRVARLLPNGHVDPTFNPGTGPDGNVSSVALQPDGKVLITGSFTHVAGTARNLYARLNGDGSLDTTYAATQPFLASGEGRQFIALPDGRALLVGPQIYFSISPFVTRGGFMRLNTNGTCDTSFPSLPIASAGLYAGAVTPSGNYLVGGLFSTTDGTARTNLMQVSTNGVVDPSFPAAPVLTPLTIGFVRTLHPMLDGRIVVNYGYGGSTNWILRLNSNGTTDGSFASPYADGAILAAAVQPDGKVWIAGDFLNVNAQQRLKVARLNADGTLDSTYNPGSGTGTSVLTVTLQPDGKVLLGGAFSGYNGFFYGDFVRLLGDLTGNQPHLAVSSSTFSVTAFTVAGKSYTLQYKTALTDTNWISLPAVPGNGLEMTLADSSATNASRIYRIVEN